MGAGASLSLCRGPASVKVLKRSTRVEPEQQQTQDPGTRPVFGVPLEHLRDAGRLQHGVPVVLKTMVEFLEKNGLKQSGVFRVCGSAPRCTSLRGCLDRGECVDLEEVDVPTVAALLKLYLRELPSGLIPHTHSTRMQQALIAHTKQTDSKDGMELVKVLKETLHHLPDDNYNILSFLLHFLSRVAAHSQWNHMTSENLATVFGPCIFRVPEGPRMLEEQTMCNTLTLHLLEKHTHLIPNTHTVTHEPTAAHTSQLQQEQSFTSEKLCDVSVGVVKEASALPPTVTDTHPLSRSSCLIKKDQFCLSHSHMILAPERPTPESSPTDDSSHSDISDETHGKTIDTLSETGDTHSQKDVLSNTSHAHSLRAETQTESRSTHSESGSADMHISDAHTETRILQSKHTPSDYSCTHTRSPGAHAARLMEEAVRGNSSENIVRCSLPFLPAAPPASSVHRPISSQAPTGSSGPGSASCATSSQSRVIKDGTNSFHEMTTSQLRRRIQKLKRAIRNFGESFQNTHNYTPALDDKMAKLVSDLSEAREQLKVLRSGRVRARVSEKSETQELSVEVTLHTLTLRLREKRLELNLPERIQDMSHTQLALEKTALQKCLLYYESLHGRPSSKEERSVMRVLYDRYHLVKQAFYNTHTQTTGTRGSEECVRVNLLPGEDDANLVLITQTVTQATDSTNDTHFVNRLELLRQLKQTRMEKRQLRTLLKEYEKKFLIKNGRSAQRKDRLVMAKEYSRYNALKDRLRLLRGMLGKKHDLKAVRVAV